MNITEKISKKELEELLIQFDINSFEEYEMIDSSHGERDIRHNYIIDKKYVLRINSAKVMTEERIKELNILINRGLKEWNNEKGYLTDTCLTAQDKYKAYLDYFRIAYLA